MLRDCTILNPALLYYLASAGHTDVVVVADAGLPLPAGVPVVDLSLVPGTPSFVETVEAIFATLKVQSAVVAKELKDHPHRGQLHQILDGITIDSISHEDFKGLLPTAHLIIRTGECTPFANVALIAGVTF